LSQDFDIVDDRTSELILREVVEGWLAANTAQMSDYLPPGLELPPLLRQHLPDLALDVARSFIKRAKDYRLAPYQLEDMLRARTFPEANSFREGDLPLARMGLDIYRDYQARLARTGVDFDDLIRLAVQAIELDPDFLGRLRRRWPYILEDEAQDSSQLQQDILEALTGPSGTWVRVGDPNQAIYETFTTANPKHLRRFIQRDDVFNLPMPESGRSTPSIMALANYLIDWTITEHPCSEVQDALAPPHIEPTPPGDPQPNPPDQPQYLHFRPEKYKPAQEIQILVRSVKQWLQNKPTKTVAILDARNKRGVDIANALRRADVPYVELLNSTAATRSTAGVLGNILKYLARPEDSRQLATVFHVWQRHNWDLEDMQPFYQLIETTLQNCAHLEDFLWPRPGRDWLAERIEEWRGNEGITRGDKDATIQGYEEADEEFMNDESPISNLQSPTSNLHPPASSPLRLLTSLLTTFRTLVRRWQQAASLPIDQLILLLAQDLFDNPADLALSHKFAVLLRRRAADHPQDRLPQFVAELAEIARNQRRFLGFDEDMSGFEPPPGKVTVATMHRAKGLEWDRVYLMGVNNYSFPSAQPQDSYFSEKWFVRDSLNLEAEALAQLEALVNAEGYTEGQATELARLDLVRERLRLFYVGLTRARQELIITWNTGQQYPGKRDNQPAVPFVALQTWWEEQGVGSRE
jgi:DNA helicase-2/ATP-dependent DNA helicase PcrA